MLIDSASSDELLVKVREAYSNASDNPDDSHPFPLGFDFALSLGYPEALLQSLPRASVDRFTGVSNVSVFAEIPAGSTVLDFGCGGGTDSLIAAAKTGPKGQVFGVDFSRSMLSQARAGAEDAGAVNVEFREAEGQSVPFADGTFDVALVNGIFNLNPNRHDLFQELARVIRPGGVLFGAEIVLCDPMDEEERAGLANWFS
ncbi:MAG: methyltransferase domain-containing protein [Chloroflexi bacterium]|nr:methyltransferase domain-containing protein [Chloroflexota bacterium]